MAWAKMCSLTIEMNLSTYNQGRILALNVYDVIFTDCWRMITNPRGSYLSKKMIMACLYLSLLGRTADNSVFVYTKKKSEFDLHACHWTAPVVSADKSVSHGALGWICPTRRCGHVYSFWRRRAGSGREVSRERLCFHGRLVSALQACLSGCSRSWSRRFNHSQHPTARTLSSLVWF